jgi:undecaprenyl diphosphate synthase
MSNNEKSDIPVHLGLILDGNRRWAAGNGKSPMDGHRAGFDTFKLISDAALARGIKYLSIYAFSTENWKRSKEEVGFLMNFLQLVIDKHMKELHKKGIKFVWLGSSEGLDNGLVAKLKKPKKLAKTTQSALFACVLIMAASKKLLQQLTKPASRARLQKKP